MENMKTVFVNGCFDVLHRGHIELFEFAKSHGDRLIVAIDSDARVKSMKGKDRPFHNQTDREFVLRSIRYIDDVRIFDSAEDLEKLTLEIQPHTMIVGSDWKDKEVIGSQHAKELKFFNRIGDYSTTKILQHSTDR